MNDRKAMCSVLRDMGYWACILALLVVAGCGPVKKAADWITGSGDPALVGEDADGDGVPDVSPAAKIIGAVKDSGLPFSEGAAAALAYLVGRYIGKRKKEGAA